ncbi:MAG: superinfection exclusion B family protein [Pedobacter sp.]|nr:superinfection exclusion B family protein [Cellulomonas sp.]
MSWPNFLEKGKISTRLLLPLAIVSGCFLFLPADWKVKMGIQTLSIVYSQYIGLVFLITTVFLILDIVSRIVQKIKYRIYYKKIAGYIEDHIKSLTRSEKSLLREFYITNSDTLQLPMNHPTVAGLVSKRILIQIGNMGGMLNFEICFNYSITERAKNFISNEAIDLPRNPTDRDYRFLEENRFTWGPDRYW